ncbi:hypothetical protein ACIGXF_16580 [Streptomyces sp. NPDC053086]|uniref:hypothetical protein n=1 Tax=unclassified Streptomyces TaxID=2593676 RepID=UPI0037D18378
MRIQVTGEDAPDAIDVTGGQPATVIEVDTTIVVPGHASVATVNSVAPDGDGNVLLDAADVGADPAGAASTAVAAHTIATDPHGDRAYADGKLAKTANLSDLSNASTARTNLGLGGAATLNIGTTAGTVASGSDSRLSDARTPTAHASSHASGGSDPVTPAAIGALTQTTGDSRYLLATARAAANGVASLDSGTKVPSAQIPDLSATYATVAAYGNVWTPADQGLITWSFDPAACTATGTTLSAGFIYLIEIVLRQAATIAKINAVIGTAGATLTANQCLAGLYDTTGTRRGVTGDMSTTWNSAGNKAMSLTSSYSAAAGRYYLALLFNGTTSPTFACGSTLGATFTPGNANLAAGSYRFCRSASGQTSLPTSITLSGYTPDANNVWLGAS